MKRIGRTGLVVALAAGLASVAGGAAAQANQTAEGAQQFLAQLVQGGRASIEGRLAVVPIRVSGTYQRKTGKKDWYGFDKHQAEPLVYEGTGWAEFRGTGLAASGACGTAVTGVAYGEFLELEITQQINARGDGYIDAATTSAIVPGKAPYMVQLDWGKVRVERLGTGDGIAVSWSDPVHKDTWIRIRTNQGTEMVDRMEYAGKFLQMSCDEAASTGF